MDKRVEPLKINGDQGLEKELSLTDEDWGRLFDAIPDAICLLDNKYRIILANKAMSNRLGLLKEECIGSTCYRAVHSKECPADSCPHTRTLQDGTTHAVEVYEQNLGGWFLVTTTPWTDAEGNIIGSIHIARDITARKLMENKYRVVADNTYNWEFWLSPEDLFLYTSPSCRNLTGYPADEFEKNPDLMLRLLHPEDRHIFETHRHEARNQCENEEIEFRIVHADGSIRWIGHSCQPLYDKSGAFIGTRGSNRDITVRKSMEDEREKLITELRDALAKVKLLSGFLPICASCKKIRDDKGYWKQIESYIHEHSEAQFSHGICPDCAKKLYPEYFKG